MNYSHYLLTGLSDFETTTFNTAVGKATTVSGVTRSNVVVGISQKSTGFANIMLGYGNTTTSSSNIYIGHGHSTGSNSLIINTLSTISNSACNNYFNIMDVITSSNHTSNLYFNRDSYYIGSVNLKTSTFSENAITLSTTNGTRLEIAGDVTITGTLTTSATSSNATAYSMDDITVSNSGTFTSGASNSNLIFTTSVANNYQFIQIQNTNATTSSNNVYVEYSNSNGAMYTILASNSFSIASDSNVNKNIIALSNTGSAHVINFYNYSAAVAMNIDNDKNVDIGNDLNVSGNTTISGNISISGTLNVSGLSTLSNTSNTGTIAIDGISTLNSNLTVSGTVNLQSNLYVTTTDTAYICNLNVSNLTIANDATVTVDVATAVSNVASSNTVASLATSSGTYTAAWLFQRYQPYTAATGGDTNTGDVKDDSALVSGTVGSTGNSSNTVHLSGASSSNDIYNHMYVYIYSNTTHYVRKITDYDGGSNLATVSDDFTTDPTSSFSYEIYDNTHVGFLFNEDNDSVDLKVALTDSNYVVQSAPYYYNLRAKNLYSTENIYVAGTLNVTGSVVLDSNLSITGTLGIVGLSTLSNTSNTGTLTVDGLTTLVNQSNTGTLTVDGLTTLNTTSFSNTATFFSPAFFSNTVTLNSALTICNNLNITGFQTITSNTNGESNAFMTICNLNNINTQNGVFIEMSNDIGNYLKLGLGSGPNYASATDTDYLFSVSDAANIRFSVAHTGAVNYYNTDGDPIFTLSSTGNLAISGAFTLSNLTLSNLISYTGLTVCNESGSNTVGDFPLSLSKATKTVPIQFLNTTTRNYLELGHYDASYMFYIALTDSTTGTVSVSTNSIMHADNSSNFTFKCNVNVGGTLNVTGVTTINSNVSITNNENNVTTFSITNTASTGVYLFDATGTKNRVRMAGNASASAILINEIDSSSTQSISLTMQSFNSTPSLVNTFRVQSFNYGSNNKVDLCNISGDLNIYVPTSCNLNFLNGSTTVSTINNTNITLNVPVDFGGQIISNIDEIRLSLGSGNKISVYNGTFNTYDYYIGITSATMRYTVPDTASTVRHEFSFNNDITYSSYSLYRDYFDMGDKYICNCSTYYLNNSSFQQYTYIANSVNSIQIKGQDGVLVSGNITGSSTNCNLANFNSYDLKNYFYVALDMNNNNISNVNNINGISNGNFTIRSASGHGVLLQNGTTSKFYVGTSGVISYDDLNMCNNDISNVNDLKFYDDNQQIQSYSSELRYSADTEQSFYINGSEKMSISSTGINMHLTNIINVSNFTNTGTTTLGANGQEVYSEGTTSGFSWYDRTTGGVSGSDRWVIYASSDSTYIWQGTNKLGISDTGTLTVSNITLQYGSIITTTNGLSIVSLASDYIYLNSGSHIYIDAESGCNIIFRDNGTSNMILTPSYLNLCNNSICNVSDIISSSDISLCSFTNVLIQTSNFTSTPGASSTDCIYLRTNPTSATLPSTGAYSNLIYLGTGDTWTTSTCSFTDTIMLNTGTITATGSFTDSMIINIGGTVSSCNSFNDSIIFGAAGTFSHRADSIVNDSIFINASGTFSNQVSVTNSIQIGANATISPTGTVTDSVLIMAGVSSSFTGTINDDIFLKAGSAIILEAPLVDVNGTFSSFTGAHNVQYNENINNDEDYGKLIQIDTIKLDTIEQNIVYGSICNETESTQIYGILNKTTIHSLSDKTIHVVNAIGEGGIKVCSHNGNFTKGDYIVSCYCGCGRKQNDNLYRNITVAKILQNVDFTNENLSEKLVSCIYLCG